MTTENHSDYPKFTLETPYGKVGLTVQGADVVLISDWEQQLPITYNGKPLARYHAHILLKDGVWEIDMRWARYFPPLPPGSCTWVEIKNHKRLSNRLAECVRAWIEANPQALRAGQIHRLWQYAETHKSRMGELQAKLNEEARKYSELCAQLESLGAFRK